MELCLLASNAELLLSRTSGRGNGKLWQALCRKNNLQYEESDDFDIDQYEDAIRSLVAELAVAVSKDLHESGSLLEIFGKSIPVIIHELEYSDELAAITKRGNPAGVADEFIEWAAAF